MFGYQFEITGGQFMSSNPPGKGGLFKVEESSVLGWAWWYFLAILDAIDTQVEWSHLTKGRDSHKQNDAPKPSFIYVWMNMLPTWKMCEGNPNWASKHTWDYSGVIVYNFKKSYAMLLFTPVSFAVWVHPLNKNGVRATVDGSKILHEWIGLSYYLRGFIHPRWFSCRISEPSKVLCHNFRPNLPVFIGAQSPSVAITGNTISSCLSGSSEPRWD